MDCSLLPTTNNFTLYVTALRDLTAGNFSKVDQCKAEVYSALWGSGNPDISGIGMTIGYLFQAALGFVIVALVLFIDHGTTLGEQQRQPGSQTSRVANAFLDNAVFFTSSIQIAAFASVAIPDSYTSQGLSSRIILIVSSLTLISPALMISAGHGAYQYHVTESLKNDHSGHTNAQTLVAGDTQQPWARRSVTTFLLFILSFAAWLAKTLDIFQKDGTGNWPDDAIPGADRRTVSAICFRDVPQLSDGQNAFITALIMGTLPFCIGTSVVFGIASAFIQLKKSEQGDGRETFTAEAGASLLLHLYARIALYVSFAFLSSSLLWAYFRLRSLQKAMMLAVGGNYFDGVWSFGQIVGAIVFVPVFFKSLPLLAYHGEIRKASKSMLNDVVGRLGTLSMVNVKADILALRDFAKMEPEEKYCR